MEMKVQIPLRQLISAVRNLTPAQKARLRKELDIKTTGNSEEKGDDFIDYLLSGPVYSEKEIYTIIDNRKSIAAWRSKS